MASDSDGGTELLRSLREKLVGYKSLLLSQLVDQRDALLAAEDAEEDPSRQGTATSTGVPVSVLEKTAASTEARQAGSLSSPSPRAQEEKDAASGGAAVNVAPGKNEDEEPTGTDMEDSQSASAMGEKDRVSPVTKKRKLLDTGVEDGNDEDAILKKQRAAEANPEDDELGNLAAHSDELKPQRVVRTSMPSKKYLDGSLHHVREFSATAGHASHPVVTELRASVNGTSGPRESTPRVPMAHPNVEFERQLRASVRIDREVGRRSVAITRKRQLPRLPTPPRRESHWDLLLQEMKWMATDFAQERNWKRVMQCHLAKAVVVAQNAERIRQENEGRQIAREIALQVSAFWRTVERIAARSRVRFEESGVTADSTASTRRGEANVTSKTDPAGPAAATGASIETIDETGTSDNGDGDNGSVGVDALVLKLKTIDVASNQSEVDVTAVDRAKERIQFVISTGKRARDAMTSSKDSELSPSRVEQAFHDFQGQLGASQAHGPTTILAAFQLLAIRWMLELYSSGLNMFLNDQLGMGKAATIVAFLSAVELLVLPVAPSSPSSTPSLESSKNTRRGPHLIVVADQELHKWRYYLRLWHPDKYVQLYEGGSVGDRRRLQQEWRRSRMQSAGAGQFMEDDERMQDEWEGDEAMAPVYGVLCSVREFVKDMDAFTQFTDWQMFVVENEHDELFGDSEVCAALQRIRQQQRRVLCNAHPFENWRSAGEREHYGVFLLESESQEDIWTRATVDKASAVRVVQELYGQPTGARVGSWKAKDNEVTAPLLALTCLGLRRVRSEVESQLGKIEEQSLSCALSASQAVQYRSAITGFAASLNGTEERIEVWLRLFLRLRLICNCVDLVNDLEKLTHADLALLSSCSSKLEALAPLLTRLVVKEKKKVVIYSQCDVFFPILEVFLTLLDINFVRITGSTAMQQRALCHFADRTAVRVALASTRLSTGDGARAASVFGGDVIVVLDSDWSSVCDAKLRASWARMAVAGTDPLPVYRVHCENTIEAALLRAGASLGDKVFGEMTPSELLAVPADLLGGGVTLDKPSWWTSRASASTAAVQTMATLASASQLAEIAEGYVGDEAELAQPLVVYGVELDAEEHLLLASTDELTPVEWYAVNYVNGLTDEKQRGARADTGKSTDAEDDDWGDAALFEPNFTSFEELATADATRWWQDDDSMFFIDDDELVGADNASDATLVEKLLARARHENQETHYHVYAPPQPTTTTNVTTEAGTPEANQMLFRVSYRVPAPPMPPPLPAVRLKSDHATDPSGLKAKTKKHRMKTAGLVGSGGAIGSSTGVKRKLEQQMASAGGLLSKGSGNVNAVVGSGMKEQRLDLDGIPLPELEDDDFWGDTNLDALDSASWDDASVLSGILGPPGMDLSAGDATGTGAAAGGAAGGDKTSDKGGAPHATKTKKSKSGAGTGAAHGRPRKGSVASEASATREVWSAPDDLVLKKLFELYGSNWSLIAQVLNAAAAVSRFCCKKRTPRQCYDRYGKLISGSLAPAASTQLHVKDKDGKSASSAPTAKQLKAAARWTPAVLDERIGLPPTELLATFPARLALPDGGLPPPSIARSPGLVEMSLRKKLVKQQSGETTAPLHDLKSIRSSFDAIISCMKSKTAPPPIPIPTHAPPSTSTASSPASSSDPPPGKKTTSATTPVVVPPPHKSHIDMVSLLPQTALGPDEVIKRSKEAAVVAVQAAAAVASASDLAPLSASGDALMMNAGLGLLSRRSPRAAAAASASPVRVASSSPMGLPPPVPVPSKLATGMRSTASTMASVTGGRNGGVAMGVAAMAPMSSMAPMGLSVGGPVVPPVGPAMAVAAPVPVTTSTLLHVLDRMPEIKNKIQSILNRSDCSEAQKVAMIARLLSNSNAIGSAAAAAPPVSTVSAVSTEPQLPPTAAPVGPLDSDAVLSSLTADASMMNAAMLIEPTEAPLPLPAALASPTVSASTPSSSSAGGSTTTSSFGPPTSQS